MFVHTCVYACVYACVSWPIPPQLFHLIYKIHV